MKIELSIASALCCIYETPAWSVIVNWLPSTYNSAAILSVAEISLQAPV